MSTIITAIVVIVAFSFLIFIHELGHFLMAKKAGIKVIEFAIGFPPRLWSKKKGDTEYSINAIPFGGYVKLYGEDATDPKILRSKKSFAAKPLRQRIKVVIGGVLMNFLVAFILFTIGFTIGMKPMIPDGFKLINNGTIKIKAGLVIKEIDKDSPLKEKGIQSGDSIIKINNIPIQDIEEIDKLIAGKKEEIETISILQKNKINEYKIYTSKNLQIKTHQFQANFPRLQIQKVSQNSLSEKAGLKKGDIILAINGSQITSISEYNQAITKEKTNNYTILRNWEKREITVPVSNKNKVIISEVTNNSPAKKAGVKTEDFILEINKQKIFTPQQVINAIHKDEKQIQIKINRNNSTIEINTNLDKNGVFGISPRTLISPENQELNLFETRVPTSFTKIGNIKYPIHIASLESLKLMKELSILTGTGFINTIKTFISSFSVPKDVGGAIAITTMIYKSVQSGPMDVLQLIAYISLVLAVINILPLPALDGGRLFFLISEGIIGKRINAKWESYIHGIGFLILLLLIIVITYNDILRLS